MSLNSQIRSLSTLVQSAAVGGYTLPAEVADTYRVWQQLQQAELPAPRQFDSAEVAKNIVAAFTKGGPVDPMAMCRDILAAEDEQRVHKEAQAALGMAINQAASNAVSVAQDATEQIITEHLRPAHAELMGKGRDVAGILQPYTDAQFMLDLQGIVAATSSKVRAAYLELPALVERYRLIRQARDLANTVGARAVQQDANQMFATFEKTMALHPNWKHPAPIPSMPAPADATARLLWLASDQAAAARPWLPTVAEQDAAWLAQFGEAIQRQRSGRALAQHVGGLAPASVA